MDGKLNNFISPEITYVEKLTNLFKGETPNKFESRWRSYITVAVQISKVMFLSRSSNCTAWVLPLKISDFGQREVMLVTSLCLSLSNLSY